MVTYAISLSSITSVLRRIAKEVTQESLAQALDRPQSFIAKVENGERRLDIVEFVYLARLLSIDPISIIGKIPAKHKPLSAK
ncbi:XRE family transcriptional regulator [Pectobacterium parmentieri]|uniref:Helix-turn-helix domain-containing protein n=1 Tax=Pectobacterium parmentieri TaxID=1905730 RepID=A0ABS0S6F4_PECPM|nr:helix-turn-helix domain-containing protein [Pectobacterium parmentieri]MBI0496057.1 helix-turn-helix domain-containing protein [Pectobacterium parmentieri]MBI0557443.1 helix-turn-helix domain-containing protein [Pectobacterium parmentieri]MBI0561368.1 helix-turn-helix domain-containing protein [Pectobacterium parmentieri]MBI0570594.1 helix-turn-helix domain-containing protein [Pectobacterium parmentieri]